MVGWFSRRVVHKVVYEGIMLKKGGVGSGFQGERW